MSAYCPLEDAFQDPGCAPSRGKEERKKRRKVPAPAPAALPYAAQDLDRQAYPAPETVPAMRGSEDFDPYNKSTYHHPSNGVTPDPLEEYAKSEEAQHYMAIPVNGASTVISKKGFFGAQGPTDEPFADYEPAELAMAFQRPSLSTSTLHPQIQQTQSIQQTQQTQQTQQIQQTQQTQQATLGLSPPVLDSYWKPLTPSGAQTAFIEHLPPVHPIHSESRSRRDQRNQDIDAMMRKLDQMYNKLEEMNRSTPEQLTSEMLMFVSSGIFVLFLMDLLVKRGSSMRF